MTKKIEKRNNGGKKPSTDFGAEKTRGTINKRKTPQVPGARKNPKKV